MSLGIKGINYDTGTEFAANELTRKSWNLAELRADFSVIRRELRCDSINLYGTNKERLLQATQFALDEGLRVFAQLRCVDKTKEETRRAILDFAKELGDFKNTEAVVLNIGCEMSLFTKGFIPGKTFLGRMLNMAWIWPLLPIINRSLSAFASAIARDLRNSFAGKLVYASGAWERLDWEAFDFIGVNLYRDRENYHAYEGLVRMLGQGEKPAIITEFGCATYRGASLAGGGGWTIVDYRKDPPRLKRPLPRDEAEQARLLVESIRLFNEHGIHGCFIFDFIETQQLYSDKASYDLDRASYGVVKAVRWGEGLAWEKKEAFGAVAELFGSL